MWHIKCGNAEYSEVSKGSQTAIHNSYRSDQVDLNQAVKVVTALDINADREWWPCNTDKCSVRSHTLFLVTVITVVQINSVTCNPCETHTFTTILLQHCKSLHSL
jgi:hypothetical protein